MADNVGYEMSIFHNTNVQLSFVNSADSTLDTAMSAGIPHNRPAEYKIKFTIVADGSSDSLISDKVITYDSKYPPKIYDSNTAFNTGQIYEEYVGIFTNINYDSSYDGYWKIVGN